MMTEIKNWPDGAKLLSLFLRLRRAEAFTVYGVLARMQQPNKDPPIRVAKMATSAKAFGSEPREKLLRLAHQCWVHNAKCIRTYAYRRKGAYANRSSFSMAADRYQL